MARRGMMRYRGVRSGAGGGAERTRPYGGEAFVGKTPGKGSARRSGAGRRQAAGSGPGAPSRDRPKGPKGSRYAPPGRRRVTGWLLAAVVAAVAVGVAVVVGRAGAIPLVQGTTVGKPVFAHGDTAAGGTGQTVDGIRCQTSEQLVYHIHAHLRLFLSGTQVALPRGIGITPPRRVQRHFVVGGGCFYWLHTHDSTGIIHIESPLQKTYTLGDFFAIWGEPLSRTALAGHTGTVRAYVDGRPYSGDPGAITLTAHKEITLAVGGAVAHPPAYTFPPGL